MVLRKPGIEALPFENYAAMACVASGNKGVGKETIVGSTLETVEPSYIPVLPRVVIQSINSESFHSDDLYVIMHGFYPKVDEQIFDTPIGEMGQPWKTIFSLLVDWANLAKIDFHVGELTYINYDRVVMQVTGLAPAIRRAITNAGLEVVK